MTRAMMTLRTKDDRQRASSWVEKAPPGTRLEFKAPRRSLPQNDLLWSMLTDISRQVVWYDEKLSPADWKDMLTSALRKARVIPGIDGGYVPLGLRTSDLSKEEFSNLLDLANAFGQQKNVRFSHLQETGE